MRCSLYTGYKFYFAVDTHLFRFNIDRYVALYIRNYIDLSLCVKLLSIYIPKILVKPALKTASNYSQTCLKDRIKL